MNSDLISSSESVSITASNQASAKIDLTGKLTAKSPQTKPDNLSIKVQDGESPGKLRNRQQPIPPASELMQYRAIGLIRGSYSPSSEQFTQGTLITSDGVQLNAVLLGRVMSLVKKHLDLQKEHLWVVYPRTRQENDSLHIQIVGVWEPENLARKPTDEQVLSLSAETSEPVGTNKKSSRQNTAATENASAIKTSHQIPDGEFSVRGEVVYQSFDTRSLVVKIKQAPRKPTEKPKYFKLKLHGVLAMKAIGKFWDFKVKRETDGLIVETAEAVADLPKKRKPTFRGGPRPGVNRKPFVKNPGETARPITRMDADGSYSSKPLPKPSIIKPVKKLKPQDNH
ncbi:hypothetical protein [Cylindrospermopsis curvispora]|uniref:Uncharacterized protein n=1 Tax=Cylindrospermopsis curvispora GIHE-G1 TaxID=2666332 RepID=A0A7H0F452_9CYAN|nr:hypothetical protein [Cylindrospermopsis curvispora]QNP30818.1 hypothetical protein IAR63_07480 [Cylindrospermopsis curvispora GIHE-G1]